MVPRDKGYPMIIRTPHLLLRPWNMADRIGFRALNADPEVMKYFPFILSEEESDALADRLQTDMKHDGHGAWVLELPGMTSFAGVVGLNVPSFDRSLVEIFWRLHTRFWGHGHATEAAAAVLEIGFSRLGLKSICSFTSVDNVRSERVLRRLGMTHCPEKDFRHPALPPDHRLSEHLFYHMTAESWKNRKKHFPFLTALIVRSSM